THSAHEPHTPLFFQRHVAHRALHSFPTRRSSDLGPRPNARMMSTAAAISSASANGDASPMMSMLSWKCSRSRPRCCRSYRNSWGDRKSTRLNSSHVSISYAVFCLKKKKQDDKRVA